MYSRQIGDNCLVIVSHSKLTRLPGHVSAHAPLLAVTLQAMQTHVAAACQALPPMASTHTARTWVQQAAQLTERWAATKHQLLQRLQQHEEQLQSAATAAHAQLMEQVSDS